MIVIFNRIQNNHLKCTLNKKHRITYKCGRCHKGTPKGYPKSTNTQYGGIKLNVTSATKCDQCDKGTSKSYPKSAQFLYGGIKLNVNSANKNLFKT